MKNNKYLNSMLASAVAASMVPGVANAAEPAFKDIENSYAKGSIEYLVKQGIIAGYGDGKFNPKAEMTRQEFASLLARTLGIKGKPEDAAAFEDVSKWAKNDVGALAKAGIVSGYSEKKFGAQDPVTREQMAVFFVRALGYEKEAYKLNLTPQFEDADQISEYAKPAVAFAHAMGFIHGDGKKFNPKQNAQRQAVAALAERLHKDGAKTYKEKAEELINEGMPVGETPVIDLEAPEIVNVKDYTVRGVASDPFEEIIVVVESKVDSEKMLTQTVKANEKGEFEVKFDLSEFPYGDISVKAGYKYKEGEVEKTITKKSNEEGEETPVQVISQIKTEKIVYQHQVGEKASIKFQVLDAEEKPVANAKVRVQAYKEVVHGITNEDRVIKKEEVLTTDKDGYVTFEYRSYDVVVDKISAVVIDNPLVRSEGVVTVNWNVAITGLVNVDQVTDIQLGAKTERVYNVAFVDKKGEPLPEGTVVYLDLGEQADLGGLTTVTVFDAKKDSSGKPMVETVSDDPSTLLNNESKRVLKFVIGNTKGKATVQIRHDGENAIIKPTFFYKEKGNTKDTLEKNDPRVQAGAIHFVKQVPTITLSGEKDVKVSSKGRYKLNVNVLDQFGKDYKGKVTVGLEELMDNLNATNSGEIRYSLDINRDGKPEISFKKDDVNPTKGSYVYGYFDKDGNFIDYGIIYDKANNTFSTTVNTPAGLKEAVESGYIKLNTVKGTVTLDIEGLLSVDIDPTTDGVQPFAQKAQFNLTVEGGRNNDSANLVVYADTDEKLGYTKDDKKDVVKVTFVDDILKEVILTPLKSNKITISNVSQASYADFVMTMIDQNGKKVSIEDLRDIETNEVPNIAFHVYNANGELVKKIDENVDFKLFVAEDLEKYEEDPEAHPPANGGNNGTTKVGGIEEETLSYIVADPKSKQFIVRFEGLTPGKYTLRAFVDMPVKNATGTPQPNETLQDDEVYVDHEIEVQGPVLSEGELKIDGSYRIDQVGTGDFKERFTYILKDQNGVSYKAKQDVYLELTLTNKGDQDVTVYDNNGLIIGYVGAGETKTFEEDLDGNKITILMNHETYAFHVSPNRLDEQDQVKVDVGVKVKGVEESKVQTWLKWVSVLPEDELETATDRDGLKFEGTVIAFVKDTLGNFVVLDTPHGYIKLKLNDGTDTKAPRYVVDGNSSTKPTPQKQMEQFWEHVFEGSYIYFNGEDPGKETFEIYNKKQ